MSNKDQKPVPQEAVPSTESFEDKVAKAVSRAIEEALPLAVMAATQASRAASAPAKVVPFDTQRCATCMQYAGACKDQHALMIVGPSNPRRWKSWPGCILNGVQYRSPDSNTPIPVPKVNQFGYDIAQWEREEENLREGRMLSHNSGNLSGKQGRSRTKAADPVGFRGFGGQE